MTRVAIVLLSTTFFDFGLEIVRQHITSGSIDGYIAVTRGLPLIDKILLNDPYCLKIVSTNQILDNYILHPPVINNSFVHSKSVEFDEKYGNGSLARLILSDRSLSPFDSPNESSYYFESFYRLHNINPLHSSLFALRLESIFTDIFYEFEVSFVLCFSASEIYACYLDLLCNYYSIPFNHLDATRISNYYYLNNSKLSDGYSIASLIKSDRSPSSKSLALAASYLESFLHNPSYPEYEVYNRLNSLDFDYYRLMLLSAKSLIQFLRSLFTSRIDYLQSRRKFDDVIYSFRSNMLLKGLIFSNHSCLDGKKFVLFPLHVIPEKSTSVDAPLFTQHYTYLKDLALSLPSDVYICVKEHIHMLGKRPTEFYKAILTLPRVILVDPRPDIFPLIQRSVGVTCITSTTGLEGAFMNKPVLICSDNIIYSDLPYVFNYSSINGLRDFVSYVQHQDTIDEDLNTKSCVNLLAHLFDASFPLDSHTLWKAFLPPHSLTDEEKLLAVMISSRLSFI